MPTWVRIRPPNEDGWGWYQDTGCDWLFDPNGRQVLKSQVTVLDTCEVDIPENLDWQGSYITYNDVPTYGWLSPEGRIHVCAKRAHSLYARVILKTPEDTLERLGWLRVTEAGSPSCWVRSPLCRRDITQSQRDWLFDHGLLKLGG